MTRNRLPNRHQSETIRFAFEGVNYHVTYSIYEETGKLAELFMHAGKIGAGLNVMARDLAVVTSLALQYGVPQEEICAALEQERDGEMRGPLGHFMNMIGIV